MYRAKEDFIDGENGLMRKKDEELDLTPERAKVLKNYVVEDKKTQEDEITKVEKAETAMKELRSEKSILKKPKK